MNKFIIAVGLVLGIAGLTLRKTMTTPPSSTPPSKDNPPDNAYFASFPGYRRAKQSEVTSGMTANAIAALSSPIRSVHEHAGYRVAVEHHFNDSKGWHKGATIFVREDNA